MSERVVFDCNIYFQALIGPQGPAAACLNAVIDGRLTLFFTDIVLEELTDVCLRPKLAQRFDIDQEKLERYLRKIRALGHCVEEVPHVFDFERDPKDEHYVDLAIATQAKLLVSRDKDLLSLMDDNVPAGQNLQQLYPELEILSPSEMLSRLEASG